MTIEDLSAAIAQERTDNIESDLEDRVIETAFALLPTLQHRDDVLARNFREALNALDAWDAS